LLDHTRVDELRLQATETGDWRKLNAYLRGSVLPYLERIRRENLVLLTWGPDTTPAELSGHGLMLNRPTGLRANLANRTAIRVLGKRVSTAPNHRALVALAIGIASHRSRAPRIGYTFFESSSGTPLFQQPAVDAGGVLRASHTTIADFKILWKHLGEIPLHVKSAVLSSGLSQAWPKKLLSNALATHARNLVAWERAVLSGRRITTSPFTGRATSYITSFLACS